MPKVKPNKRAVIERLVEEFGSDVLQGDGDKLKCVACNKEIGCERKSNIIAHLKTAKHKKNMPAVEVVGVENEVQNVDACRYFR